MKKYFFFLASIGTFCWLCSQGSYLKMEDRQLKIIPKPLVKLTEIPRNSKLNPETKRKKIDLPETLHSLTTDTDLEKMTEEEVHFTPRSILQSGEKIGEIEERMQAFPDFQQDGLDFFKQCAERPSIALSLRAVCYNYYQKWAKKLSVSTPLSVDSEVIELSKRL